MRPDEPMLRQQGLCRGGPRGSLSSTRVEEVVSSYGFHTVRDPRAGGDLFLHPSDAAPEWRPEVGDRVSFLLGVHNGRLKAVSVCLDESEDESDDDSAAEPRPPFPPVQ